MAHFGREVKQCPIIFKASVASGNKSQNSDSTFLIFILSPAGGEGGVRGQKMASELSINRISLERISI
jgi:hypothetical protein